MATGTREETRTRTEGLGFRSRRQPSVLKFERITDKNGELARATIWLEDGETELKDVVLYRNADGRLAVRCGGDRFGHLNGPGVRARVIGQIASEWMIQTEALGGVA